MNYGLEHRQLKRDLLRTKVTIIAEAGVNHNGDLDKALKLIDAASEAGADYVKFQTFKTENLVQKDAKKAEYQVQNMNEAGSQFEMLKKLEIPLDWYPLLQERAKEKNIGFLSTGFDEESIDFLDSLGCDFFKVPSGEITNKPYLEHIAQKGKPVIVSTGMCDMADIENALYVFLKHIPIEQITILHCNTQYPTEFSDVNLKAMLTIANELKVKVGYSDHTLGIEVAIAATALGATVIEKHFTLDKNLTGPDHLASLKPDELKNMVEGIRNIELAISGSGVKVPSESEKKNTTAARKSIHAINDLKPGHVTSKDDLIMLRPGDGISPMLVGEIIGRKVLRSIPQFDKLKWEDLE